jgi:integrase
MQHLSRNQLLILLKTARAESERNWCAILIGFWHGLRVSEIVGRRTKLQGTFGTRKKAEARRRQFRGARISKTTRLSRAGRVPVYQVLTSRPTFSGGLTPESFADGFLIVKRLKGSNKTTQPLVYDKNPLLNERSAVAKILEGAGPTKPLFPISRLRFWQLMQRYAATAGIPKHLAHPHILKHSIAMQTIRSAGIENVRTYLGHKSIASTGSYLQVDDDAASRAITGALRGAR